MTQSEAQLEIDLVTRLIGLGYAPVTLPDMPALHANLRLQLGVQNNVTLSDTEFARVLNHLDKGNVFERAKTLRRRMQLSRDDGTPLYLQFLNTDDWCRNQYQVTTQVTVSGHHKTRYDITLLINGLPLVQIELKRRGLEMKEAFNQIQRYQKHSFWSAQGLFHFVQLFVISNGVNTKYYANARRQSFKQTFYWAAEDNKTIRELTAFTMAFLNREHVVAASASARSKQTTKDLFHERLHSYVITDAIKDENVLRFAVEYVGKYKKKSGTATEVDIEVEDIDTKELMESPARLEKITDYILAHHALKTRNKEFTAMMCVSSVDVLIQYYELFAKRKAEGKHKLKVATIFSYTSNEEDKDADGNLDEGGAIIGGEGSDPHTREKLDGFIRDYNAMFGTNYSTKDTQSFYNYYQDIAKKVKERKVDILLVVNMFLTGFDCKTLNTLYVDKNLKYHGLVQAYSRTNRILNEVKSQGNIVVFRNLKKRTDEAIALFSNVKAKEEIFVPPYEDYVKRFNEIVLDLIKLTPTVRSVKDLKDEEAELQFVKIFRELMRLRNILESFSEFSDEDLSLPAQRFADYRSAYLDLYDKVKSDTHKEKASILNDVDFELELIHRDVINVQYILTMLAKLYGADAADVPQIRKLILDTVAGGIELRSKKELIEKFIEQNLPKVGDAAEIPDTFESFWEAERIAAFDRLVKEEQLDADKLKKVIDRYVYTGKEPLPDPDIMELINHPLKLTDRATTRKRVLGKVVDFVSTFILGIAA